MYIYYINRQGPAVVSIPESTVWRILVIEDWEGEEGTVPALVLTIDETKQICLAEVPMNSSVAEDGVTILYKVVDVIYHLLLEDKIENGFNVMSVIRSVAREWEKEIKKITNLNSLNEWWSKEWEESAESPVDSYNDMGRIRDIEALGLSVRAREVLKRNGITSIGLLLATSPEKLFNLRNLNERCRREIRQKLFAAGYSRFDDGTEIQYEE